MRLILYHFGIAFNKHITSVLFPYCLVVLFCYGFDLFARITRKKLSVSSERVKKFSEVTQFQSFRLKESGFKPTFTLEEGLTRTLQYEFGFEDKKSY